MVFICSEKNEMMERKEKNFRPIFIFHHRFFMLATWIQIVRARPQFPQHSLHTHRPIRCFSQILFSLHAKCHVVR